MDIIVRPIHTEDDYDAALALVGTLLDAEPGTREGDRLDALVASVETYEAHRWPIAPPARSTA